MSLEGGDKKMDKVELQEILNALNLHSKHIDEKLENMEKIIVNRMDEMKVKLEERMDEMKIKLEKRMDARFYRLEKRLERLEKKFDGLRIELTKTQETVDYLPVKVCNMRKNSVPSILNNKLPPLYNSKKITPHLSPQ
jgi:hypothetical protein